MKGEWWQNRSLLPLLFQKYWITPIGAMTATAKSIWESRKNMLPRCFLLLLSLPRHNSFFVSPFLFVLASLFPQHSSTWPPTPNPTGDRFARPQLPQPNVQQQSRQQIPRSNSIDIPFNNSNSKKCFFSATSTLTNTITALSQQHFDSLRQSQYLNQQQQ
jgi:hypothetical protein